jgi:hypothetical protein
VRLTSQSQKRLWCLALALVTVAVFWPVWHNGFVEYDDDEYIFQNPTVQAGWTWNGLIWAFAGAHAVNYHPVTWLSHMTDCQFFGLNAGAHHLVNVAIHAANAALLWWLLDSLTGRFWRSGMVAAVFALHPLRVESVAWAAERKDVLCAFFFLLTLLAYVKHVRAQKPDQPVRIGPELRMAAFWYLLALLSKAMVVTLPVLLLLLDFWPLQRMTQFKAQWRVLLWEKVPFFFLALLFGLATYFAQHGLVHPRPMGAAGHVAAVATDYVGYMRKIFWPADLSFLYVRPEQVPAAQGAMAVLLMAGISAVALAEWRRRPWLLSGWFWFVVMLLPVTTVTLSQLWIADRYTYLPGIGFTLIVVWSVVGMAERLMAQRFRPVMAAGAAAILIFCAVRTREQIGYWHDTGTLAEHALAIDPNNDVAQQLRRIYQFEQEHPGVREGKPQLTR